MVKTYIANYINNCGNTIKELCKLQYPKYKKKIFRKNNKYALLILCLFLLTSAQNY